MITRLGLNGYGVAPAGNFSGKAAVPHPVGLITRLGLNGYASKRVGDFTGREPAGGHPVGNITRLGLNGFCVRRSGDFTGKTIVVVSPVAGVGGRVVARRIYIRRPPSIRAKDVFPEIEHKPEIKREVEVEGVTYELKVGRPPSAKEAIKELPAERLEEKIKIVMKELAVTRKEARKALIRRAAIELREDKRLKEGLVLDDEEFYLLLFMEEA
ncbi:MAG: hypothetical protein BMS9Abin11_1836 [Gammaproteobacteria bacterium]|nr:MAG: hypothetical protein BMS9Abin11_1836 [Gammaproteobacteria bacterium]